MEPIVCDHMILTDNPNALTINNHRVSFTLIQTSRSRNKPFSTFRRNWKEDSLNTPDSRASPGSTGSDGISGFEPAPQMERCEALKKGRLVSVEQLLRSRAFWWQKSLLGAYGTSPDIHIQLTSISFMFPYFCSAGKSLWSLPSWHVSCSVSPPPFPLENPGLTGQMKSRLLGER